MDVLATLADGALTVRRARAEDLPALVALIAEDPVSAGRGDAVGDGAGDLVPYTAAFAEIDADPAHLLVCLDEADGTTVGTLQLSVLPNLGRRVGGRSSRRCTSARPGAGTGTAPRWWAGRSRRPGAGGAGWCS